MNCIPVKTGEGKNAQVYAHFGSTPYFTIYDTDAQFIAVIDNANSHHEHGACNPIAALQGKTIDIVVTGGMGSRAVMMFDTTGIKVFKSVSGSVENIIKTFGAQDIEELTAQNACASHGCN